MSDLQIRIDIRSQWQRFFALASDARLIEEWEICGGRARADMALICQHLIGIEIKGPRDSLRRLPDQVAYYSKCFDQILLVVHENLARDAARLVPKWWGLVIGSGSDRSFTYELCRRPIKNRFVDLETVLSLLWRPEIEALYGLFCDSSAPARASKRALRAELLVRSPPKKLKAAGIDLLRRRKDWRYGGRD